MIQILGARYFAGSVAQESGGDILTMDTATIVGNADIGNATIANLNSDVFGVGIDGVFHHFLYHRRRALHHLTGGDQLCYVLIQHTNDRHGDPSF